MALAAAVRGIGISDLFVRVGPLSDDGSLDPAKPYVDFAATPADRPAYRADWSPP
jgi:hypothetical protein